MVAEILLLVKQVCSRTSKIDNFRTTVTVFLEAGTLKAVERVRDALATTHYTLILIVSEGAFVTDSHKSSRSDVAIAYGAFAVAFVA